MYSPYVHTCFQKSQLSFLLKSYFEFSICVFVYFYSCPISSRREYGVYIYICFVCCYISGHQLPNQLTSNNMLTELIDNDI